MTKTKMTISSPGMEPIDFDDLLGSNESEQLIKIKSAQLKDEYCNYSFEQRVALGVVNKFSVKSQVKFHNDLKDAFTKLNAHLAVICEEVAHKDIRDIDTGEGRIQSITEKLEAFTVDAFHYNNDAVTLIGQKLLSTGECVKLETPEVEMSGNYQFSNELLAAVLVLINEVLMYHNGDKKAPDPQREIEFPEPETAEA
jgi:hypothetical protein